jgi:hypothetical protein
MAAVVRECDVDPCWLIHGEYDSATQSASLDGRKRVTASNLPGLAASPRTGATTTPDAILLDMGLLRDCRFP